MEQGQNHDTPKPETDLVEIWFWIEKDADGYPESKSWEGMWSRVTSQGFLVESVPFYLKNVSRGDLVAAEEGVFQRFSHVIERGGHNTYRLLMDGASEDEAERAISELEARGLTVEKNEAGILLAVDVPPTVAQQEIDADLMSNTTAGRWQMQDGYLSSIETT
jgi:hypothetical protein